MKRLLLLLILLTSYIYAGMYGGVEWQKMSFDGTYKETYKDVTQEWKTEADMSAFGLTLGYGHADSLSGEIYLATDFESGKFGSNLRYGFDIFENNFLPHIFLGNGLVYSSKPSLSNNPNAPQGYVNGYGSPFVQLGVGASYALSDTVELYGDVMLLVGYDDSDSNTTVYEYDNDGVQSSYPIDYEQKWDAVSVGFQIGVKFHAFGSSTMRRKYLKQEALEVEKERQKGIDAFID